jgi:hypothetical protein
MPRPRSQLHLQLGQEVIYVLMALGIMTSLILLAKAQQHTLPLPETRAAVEEVVPDCTLPGRGPCYGPGDLPPCTRSAGGCVPAAMLPDCTRSGRGCMTAVDLPDCMQPGRGPCVTAPELRKPPILNLTEKKGFRFPTNSYVVTGEFRTNLLNDIVPEILRLGEEYDARVVEVVGYTDSVPVSKDRRSLLDQRLNPFLAGSGSDMAEFADNVGLGMMRAAAVVRVLKDLPELRNRGFTFLAMSAGQTIGPDDRPVAPEIGQVAGDERRRRVEIRLRRPLYEEQGQPDRKQD